MRRLLCVCVCVCVWQKARLARIHSVKTQSCSAFIQSKIRAQQRLLALQSRDGQQQLDALNDDDVFQLQHHHLLSCLERTTVCLSLSADTTSHPSFDSLPLLASSAYWAIPWGHSGPLCHALSLLLLSSSLSWTSMRRRRATVLACDSSDTWWMGVRRLAVANGPNIFQMLLVFHYFNNIKYTRKNIRCWYPFDDSFCKHPSRINSCKQAQTSSITVYSNVKLMSFCTKQTVSEHSWLFKERSETVSSRWQYGSYCCIQLSWVLLQSSIFW